MTGNLDQQDWFELYKSAVLETDPNQLPTRIRAAQTAIWRRLQELSAGGSLDERAQLEDSLRNLEVVSREVRWHVVERSQARDWVGSTYVVLVNRDRRYLEVTDGVCQLLGYSRRELLERKIDDVAAPELRSEVPETFERYIGAGGMSGDYVLVRKDGTRVPIQFESWVFPDGSMVARWFPKTT